MEDKIWAENLTFALQTAIEARERFEKEVWKYTKESALLAGWKSNLKTLEEGRRLEIRYE